MRTAPERWIPRGIAHLENAANLAVRERHHTVVLASPGAGKTELLAQRAVFLLETGECPHPKRILAISFKRDAARNLARRVAARSTDETHRFQSLTLDAFAKGLVDRFLPSVPKEWRPQPHYEVRLKTPRGFEMRQWLEDAAGKALPGWSDGRIRTVFLALEHGAPLPTTKASLRRWREVLSAPSGAATLSFPMLCRLAAFCLVENPQILRALRQTYSHVLMDEFQDTTGPQWDLVKTCFHGSNTILTVVGDPKQRIMEWAGAIPGLFSTYQADFTAKRYDLLRNYRSAPRLVEIQNSIAARLEKTSLPSSPQRSTTTHGECEILEFGSQTEEACWLAEFIANGIRAGRRPRDFCIIVRQKCAEVVEELQTELARRGIELRDESQLQDLLAEPISEVVLAALTLASRDRHPPSWVTLLDHFRVLQLNPDTRRNRDAPSTTIGRLVRRLRGALDSEELALVDSPRFIADLIGDSRIRSTYRQYALGSYLSDVLTGLSTALEDARSGNASLAATIDRLAGTDVIPAMTIHKSKGLEFHTVLFMGLEDHQWWSFVNNPAEGTRSFFVAFSRAIERVYFTYCDRRCGRAQDRESIDSLYSLLLAAGVPARSLRVPSTSD